MTIGRGRRTGKKQRSLKAAAWSGGIASSSAAPALAQHTQGIDLSDWQGHVTQTTWKSIKTPQGSMALVGVISSYAA
jgi:hypothetical protein